MRRSLLPLAASLALAACNRLPAEPAGVYAKLCSRCHGGDGRGNPEILVERDKLDLLASDSVRRADLGLIRRQIAEGKGSMPAFGRKLSPEQIDGLARFTLELARASNVAPPAVESPSPHPPSPAAE